MKPFGIILCLSEKSQYFYCAALQGMRQWEARCVRMSHWIVKVFINMIHSDQLWLSHMWLRLCYRGCCRFLRALSLPLLGWLCLCTVRACFSSTACFRLPGGNLKCFSCMTWFSLLHSWTSLIEETLPVPTLLPHTWTQVYWSTQHNRPYDYLGEIDVSKCIWEKR